MKNYAIKVLEDEAHILRKIIFDWRPEGYQEALKERERRLKELEQAIEKLKT